MVSLPDGVLHLRALESSQFDLAAQPGTAVTVEEMAAVGPFRPPFFSRYLKA